MRDRIEGPACLLGRRLDAGPVRQYLASLGPVTESVPEEEQGPEHFVAVRPAGLEVMAESGVIQTVTLFRSGQQGYAGYVGPLPLGLSLAMRREAVRLLLGPPQFAIETMDRAGPGRTGPMDRYDGPHFSTALDYDGATGQILTVQLLSPAAVPR